MAFKTFEQAVADKDIILWNENAPTVARASWFNKNTKFMVDNMKALYEGVFVLIQNNNTAIDEGIREFNELVVDVKNNMNAIGAKLDSDVYLEKMQYVDSKLNELNDMINGLDSMYATDSEVAAIINEVNEAWKASDGDMQTAWNLLIDARYTKDETDALLEDKADKVNVYTKTEANSIVNDVKETLETKVDKVDGKELSSNDFTDDYKNQVDINTANIETKVDKVDGKALSTNDFTDEFIDKITDLGTRLSSVEGIVSSEDADLDTVKEIVDFIKANKDVIDSISTTKVDKVDGKALSANDFTDEYKDKVDGNASRIEDNKNSIDSLTENKVDKVDGKALSTNDFTNEYREQVDTNKDNIGNHETRISTLESIVSSDDEDLDTIKEVVDFIKDNKTVIDSISTTKVDKVEGKGLSTNDFTDTYKDQVDSNTSRIENNESNISKLDTNKVDKVDGKELSSNDFTDDHKSKLEILMNLMTFNDDEVIISAN